MTDCKLCTVDKHILTFFETQCTLTIADNECM